MEGDFLTHFEADHHIQALQELPVEEYGSPAWTRQHEVLYKLNLQSHRNAKAREDEFVMDLVVTWDKVKLLIYDLLMTDAWKTHIMPLVRPTLCELSSARSYSLIYHEGMVANFLEVVLYHQSACEEAGDHLIEMIDWCYRKIVKLSNYTSGPLKVDLSKEEELQDQVKEMDFAMGISSISIIRFITDHLSSLTLAVVQQLVEQCDIFCILVPLMEQKPWIKEVQSGKMVFNEQSWSLYKDEARVPQVEAQIWLIVYNLFMNNDVRAKYELNSYRKNNLLRLRKFMNTMVMDQIPVLQHLMRALEELSIINENATTRFSAFLIRQMPELMEKITSGKDWPAIAEHQRTHYLVETEAERKAAMDLLMTGLDEYLGDPVCGACGATATNRCSKCKSEWYCSRKCQVTAWKKHKEVCALMADTTAAESVQSEEAARPKITEITNE